ncbi:MAG: EamA family transporter [Henriciella sp.]|uniref:EamA family transporter n=1 Tax=Henriciella sp. TaxID=1968823 RepID=UPI003C719E92
MILFVVTTNALSQTFLKQGMVAVGKFDLTTSNALMTVLKVGFQPWVIVGLATMAVSMAAHLWVLSRVPLTFAFPFIALSYVFVLAIGYFVFKESLNINHFIGTFLIIGGLVFIGFAGDQSSAAAEPVALLQETPQND